MYSPDNNRYQTMQYRRCGKSGLKLPLITLGMWYNFGDINIYENCRKMVLKAFDLGITHFDLANNYGPSPGSAEQTMGKILSEELKSYRDQIIITTKAGYDMWPGPYGDGGSKKYLTASLDQSLKRLGTDYVDIFYSHRFDPDTPLEETMGALDLAVRQGKALYAGISNYNARQTARASAILKQLGTPCIINQVHYSLFDRTIEENLLDCLEKEGMGCIVFSPLAQGLLTDKYLKGIPKDSRAANKSAAFINPGDITEEKLASIRKLNTIALERGQSLAGMALAWVLQKVTSVIIGASRPEQIENNVEAIGNLSFTKEELDKIDAALR